MFDPTDHVRAIEAALAPHADAARAEGVRAYLKLPLTCLGVPVPQIREVVRAFRREHRLADDEAVALATALWATGVHEMRTVAIVLLERRKLAPRHLPGIEAMLRDSGTWAYVDALAVHVVGPMVAADPALSADLDRWATDGDFWIRRSALLALLLPLRRGAGDFDRFARYADPMLEEREFFIRKAIGWVLREVARTRPALVREWVAPRRARMSGLTFREATRALPEADRAALA
jgi:3-methyladenine DNA glycosylase AlkD